MTRDEVMKAYEGADVFADQYEVSVHPFGCTLTFVSSKSRAPDDPEVVARREGQAQGLPPLPLILAKVATVHLTPEHLKAIIFTSWRYITQVEAQLGHQWQVPKPIADAMSIKPEEWAAFWNPQGAKKDEAANVDGAKPQAAVPAA